MLRVTAFYFIAAAFGQRPSSEALWSKLNPFFGADLSFIDIRFANVSLFSYPTNYWGLTLGSNYTYFHTENEILSAGPGAQVTGAFQFLGAGATNWMIQVPIYGYARLGAGATAYNVQRLGIGAGLGARFTTFQVTYSTLSGNYIGRLRQSFINPTAFVDLTFNLRRTSPTTVRLYLDLLSSRRNTDILGSLDPTPLEFRTYGFSLIYSIANP